MSANLGTIVSVSLWDVDPPLNRVVHLLPQCRHLSALYIGFMFNKENLAQMVAVIPRLTQLDTIRYWGIHNAVKDSPVVAAVLCLTQLRYIRLEWVRPGGDVLVLTADWTRLRTVVLWRVRMSAWSWGRFVSSLLTVPHPVHVTLYDTDIDADTVGWIQSSQHFTGAGEYEWKDHTTFTTVPHAGMMGGGGRVVGLSHHS